MSLEKDLWDYIGSNIIRGGYTYSITYPTIEID